MSSMECFDRLWWTLVGGISLTLKLEKIKSWFHLGGAVAEWSKALLVREDKRKLK